MSRRYRRRRTYSLSKWFRQRIIGLAFLLFGVLLIGAVNYVLGFVPQQYIYFDNGVLAVSNTPPTTTTVITNTTTNLVHLEPIPTPYNYTPYVVNLTFYNPSDEAYNITYTTADGTTIEISASASLQIKVNGTVVYTNSYYSEHRIVDNGTHIRIDIRYPSSGISWTTAVTVATHNITSHTLTLGDLTQYIEYYYQTTTTTTTTTPLPAVSNTVIIQLIGWAVGILFVLVALRKLGLSI